jgi:hypothetical protein
MMRFTPDLELRAKLKKEGKSPFVPVEVHREVLKQLAEARKQIRELVSGVRVQPGREEGP